MVARARRIETSMSVKRGGGLVERRLLPAEEQDAFQYELARFHLEDLNLLAERRRGQRGGGAWTRADAERAGAIIQAARWQRDGFLLAIRRFIEEGRATDADGFGPALLLLALDAPGNEVVRGLSARVRAQVDKLIEKIGVVR